jgi:hypothetical protein
MSENDVRTIYPDYKTLGPGMLKIEVLLEAEPATCTLFFVVEDRLSRIACNVHRQANDAADRAMVDRFVARTEQNLGWATRSDERDYGSWRNVDYAWSGAHSTYIIHSDTGGLVVSNELREHEATMQRLGEEQANRTREQAEEQIRASREAERARLQNRDSDAGARREPQ